MKSFKRTIKRLLIIPHTVHRYLFSPTHSSFGSVLPPRPLRSSSISLPSFLFFSDSMDNSIDVSKDNWMSVPAFGDWEKLQGMPDYSMDFSKIRESRKQSKSDYSRISTGNEADLLSQAITAPASATAAPPVIPEKQAWLGRKTLISYFACCGTKSSS